MRRIITTIIILSVAVAAAGQSRGVAETCFGSGLQWRVGAEVSAAYVPGTNVFLKGLNPENKRISTALSGGVRAGFSFGESSPAGMLYKGVYQGVGVGAVSFFSDGLLGTPVSAYVYQGAPIVHLSRRLWLGYEWRFGAAMGWHHYDKDYDDTNGAVSTSVTAMMGLGVKLHYALSQRWTLSLGVDGVHYSNGNTSWPNAGVNSIGATIGVAYALNPQPAPASSADAAALAEEADRGRWLYDIMVYGAWRKRVVTVGRYVPEAELCPGRFGVVGLQFSPMRVLNRWVAVGPSLDLQWDESAGLEPYWIEDTYDENIKFERPPFGKQIKVGLSVHAELTMPIFSINAGVGYDFVNPKGDKRFYQSLALKTFVTDKLYLNVGYRLGDFKDPQNLMLGLGLRL